MPGTSVHGDGRLDDPQLAERTTTGHVVCPLVRQDGVRSGAAPHGRLGARRARRKRDHQCHGAAEAAQSDSAPATALEIRLARMKSRFIEVMVSMLICLGQAS